MRGSLPWQGRQGDRRDSFVQKKKQNVPVDVMCEGLPEEFKHLLKYARALRFSERPDYDYLRGLFSNLRQEAGEAREGLESLTPCFSNDFSLVPIRCSARALTCRRFKKSAETSAAATSQ